MNAAARRGRRRSAPGGAALLGLLLALAPLARAQPVGPIGSGENSPGYPPPRALAGMPPLAGAVQIYFPPDIPRLGAAPAARPATHGGWPAPAGLAPFVDEPFYAPLSTLLAHRAVSAEPQFQLEAYRATKTALQTELRARLDTLKDADPESRRRSLQAFAQEQSPRVAALESTAEALRVRILNARISVNEYVRWTVDFGADPKPQPDQLSARFRELALMDDFYQAGLSPAQRRLLREVTLDRTDGTDGWIFFSPETARIHLQRGLPPELTAKIAAYRGEKTALKTELVTMLYFRRPAAGHRAASLRALALAQAPRFAALEAMAEEIRQGFAALRDPAQPPPVSGLPPELADRIASYRHDKLAIQQELLARVEAVKASAAPADRALLADRIREAITRYTRENAERYSALEKSKDAIRDALAHLPAPSPGPGDAATADTLVKTFSDSLQQLQTYWDYRDYQTAVFQPGLSPEQRRLLFDGALDKLALPLPDAAIDPNR